MALLTDSFGEVSTSSSTGRVKTLPVLKSSPVLLKTDEKLRSSNAVKPPLIINLNSGRIKLSGTVIFGVNRTYGAFFRTLANFSSNQTFFRTEKYQFNWKLNHPSFAYTFFPSFTSPKKIDNNFVISLRPDAFTISKQIINLKTVNQDLIVPAFNTLSQSPYSIPNSNLKAYYIRTPFYASVENRQYGIVKSTNVYKSPHEKQTLLRQTYYAPSNTSDFVFEVVGQNVDSSILRYTADSIFTENSPNENYLLVPQANQSTTTKTLYFLNSTLTTPFVVGETVRIRNVNNGYLELATVTNATSNSISYSSTNLPPEISGTFIESGSSIYKFQNYDSATATTNLTNYFNSVAAPGKRGKVLLVRTNSYGEINDLRKPSKFSLPLPIVKSVVDNRNVNKLSPSIPVVKSVVDLRTLPYKILTIPQYRSVSNQPEIYKVARFESYKTTQIAVVIDLRPVEKLSSSRKVIETETSIDGTSSYVNRLKTTSSAVSDLTSTSYLGKSPKILLKSISYNAEVNALQKKFISLKEVDDNLKDVYTINISKFTGNRILTLPSNFGIYKLNSYKIADFAPIKNIEFIKSSGTDVLKQVTVIVRGDSIQKPFTNIKGIQDYIASSNYVRKYKITTFTEVRFSSKPNSILIPIKGIQTNLAPVQTLKSISKPLISIKYNLQSNTLNKKFVIVKDIPYKLSVSKFIRPIATIAIPNYPIANITSNVAQSTISTRVAPTNARENLYYAMLAPGIRNKAYYGEPRSYGTLGTEIYPVTILPFNIISQSTVSTTIAPTNARENLYYATLAPGIRNKPYYITTNQYFEIRGSEELKNVKSFLKSIQVYRSLPITFSTDKLSLYSPLNNPNVSDFRIEVTGQNLDVSISRYTLDSIFTEANPNESYLWNKQSIVSAGTKTLYFPNQLAQKFFAGDVIKITNINSRYEDYISVISATGNSITYTASNLIPEISGTFIETGATVYSKLLSTSIGPIPLRNFNISVMTPGKNATKSFGYGQNYATIASEVFRSYDIRKSVNILVKGDVQLDFATKIRSVSVLKKDPNLFDVDNIDIQKIRNVQQFDLPSSYATSKLNSISFLKTSPVPFVVNVMKRFDPDSSENSSDFSLPLVDQSLNQFSNYYYNTDTIFIESAATESYIWSRINRSPPTSSPTTKTLFFTNQRTLRFAPGEKVRVRNVTTGRSTLETVIACTFNSVTISLPSIPITETANTFIDSGFTTYSQNLVRTSVQPINARERLYYSIMAKGFKSTTSYPLGTSYADTLNLRNTTFTSTNNSRAAILKPVYADNYQRPDIIVRFKTGNFKRGSNGVQDPAVVKKAPVQFWS